VSDSHRLPLGQSSLLQVPVGASKGKLVITVPPPAKPGPRQHRLVPVVGNRVERFACVYAIGKGELLQIGYCIDDLGKRFRHLQRSYHRDELVLHCAAWVADLALAKRIFAECQRLLKQANKQPLNGWFRVPPEKWGMRIIQIAANTKRIPVMWDKEYRSLLRPKWATFSPDIGKSAAAQIRRQIRAMAKQDREGAYLTMIAHELRCRQQIESPLEALARLRSSRR
jgi:hypothetical protein